MGIPLIYLDFSKSDECLLGNGAVMSGFSSSFGCFQNSLYYPSIVVILPQLIFFTHQNQHMEGQNDYDCLKRSPIRLWGMRRPHLDNCHLSASSPRIVLKMAGLLEQIFYISRPSKQPQLCLCFFRQKAQAS